MGPLHARLYPREGRGMRMVVFSRQYDSLRAFESEGWWKLDYGIDGLEREVRDWDMVLRVLRLCRQADGGGQAQPRFVLRLDYRYIVQCSSF